MLRERKECEQTVKQLHREERGVVVIGRKRRK